MYDHLQNWKKSLMLKTLLFKERAGEMMELEEGGAVLSCSVLELFKRLCAAMYAHSTIQPSSIIDFCFHKPVKQAFLQDSNRLLCLIRKMVHVCMDVVLLRQWEWKTTDTHCISHCLGVSLSLHYQGQSAKAKSLAAAITWLLEGNSVLTETENLLQFLFLLSCPCKDDAVVDGPLTRGDQTYSYYPSSIFECPLDPKDAALEASATMTTGLFNSLPGSGFTGFMTKVESEEDLKLFGGLTHSTSADLNDPLGLPRLPSDHSDVSLLPKSPHTTPDTAVVLATPTTDLAPPTPSPPPTLALLASAASEMGQGKMLHAWEGWDTSLPFFCDAIPPASKHASQLLTTKYAALAGLASPPPSCEPVLLPQVLRTAVDGLPNPPLPSVMGTDDVLFSLSHTLHKLLVCCRTTLLHAGPATPSVLQSAHSTHHIMPLTRFVLELYQAHGQMEKFKVMDSFYQQCLQLQGTPHYLVLLSLLSQALLSYFKTVQHWVYYGILNTNQWIGIQADLSALEKRDASYWTAGYTTPHGCTPAFLAHLSHPILTCGKALNLLRVCLPKHPLCVGQFPRPQLQLAFTSQHLMGLEVHCKTYSSEVSKCCDVMAEQMRQQRIAQEEKVHAMHVEARQAARREGERVREVEKRQVEADQERKHSLAMELKEEMQRVQARRSQQLAAEREVDMEYIAAQHQQDHLWTQQQTLLQQQVKLELERHYQQLSQEAEHRRDRAEWKLARLKLASAREAFWRGEEEFWREGGEAWVGDSSQNSDKTEKDSRDEMVGFGPTSPPAPLTTASPPAPLTTASPPAPLTTASPPPPLTTASPPAPLTTASPPPPLTTASPPAPLTTASPPAPLQQLPNAAILDGEHSLQVSTRGHAPPSTLQDNGDFQLQDHTPSMPQDNGIPSTNPLQDAGHPRLQSTRGHAPQDNGVPWIPSTNPLQDSTHQSTRGHTLPSTIQYILQQEMAEHVQDVGDPQLVSTRGHAPPTSIQHLFAGGEECEEVKEKSTAPLEVDIAIANTHKYRDDFSILGDANSLHDVLAEIVRGLPVHEVDPDFLNLFPLPTLLANCIDTPLLTQCSLVNRSLLDFLISHCQLHHHFLTLKRFLLLEDGEFGHALSTRLCERLNCVSDWQQLTSPSFLNPLLVSSLEASLHHHSISSSQLSFSLKYQPHTIHTNAVKALDFLELKYKVAWPCNIIITSGCLHRYNKVLQFLLEVKRSSWVLKQTFHWLKNCCVLDELKIRQLQTYRHEFQHFVSIMHGYISSQLFGFTWEEFQTELNHHCHSLDDVIQSHNKFIDRAIFRCLLSKKARPVMNLIYDLLSSILTFSSHTQISVTAHGNFPEHNYMAMCQAYRSFRDTVRLLISVLGKLIARGYQPHLEELLLRLNFNSFY